MLASILAAAALAAAPLPASVVRVTDGDTVLVEVPAWSATPFHRIALRIVGIDTPESHRPPAKCAVEVKLGLAAAAYAKTLTAPGVAVSFVFKSFDKYGGRIDAALTLPDGRDWASIMISQGLARTYDGGTKSSWCPARKPHPNGAPAASAGQ